MVAGLAVVTAGLPALHRLVPGRMGSLLEAFLPAPWSPSSTTSATRTPIRRAPPVPWPPRNRGLAPLTGRLNVAERGLAFTFPASFPLARIDQVMARRATVHRVGALPSTASDHLPLVAHLTLR